jgi:hypothetical protein
MYHVITSHDWVLFLLLQDRVVLIASIHGIGGCTLEELAVHFCFFLADGLYG